MPYRNIVFVKLEKRLLNDHRWYTLSERDQLIYIKLILLGAETYNKIPRSESVLRIALRMDISVADLQVSINNIMANFPKLKADKYKFYFEEFEHKTNWVNPKEHPGNSQGTPKVVVDKDKDKDQDKSKTDLKSVFFNEFIPKYKTKTGLDYPHAVARDIKLLKTIATSGDVSKIINKYFEWWDNNDFYKQKGIMPTIPLLKNKLADVLAYEKPITGWEKLL